nr:hypothetical protein [Tanacetum cinerariifolium]
MHKAFSLPVIEFPLSKEVLTASEESSHCQKKRDATAEKIALLLKSSSNCQSKSYDSYAKLVPHVSPCILGVTVIITSSITFSKVVDPILKEHQMIASDRLEFMDIEIKKDDLNQKFLTSLPPEWLMHMIKKSESNSQNMAFISSAKHRSGNEEVNIASVSTASTNVSTASANIGVASISQDTGCAYITFQSNGFQIKFEDINQIDEDDMEEMAPRSQDRGRRDNYKKRSKVEEQAPKALMEIDGVGWDWSYMANDEENHALVADEEDLTEFSLMANAVFLPC